MQEVKWTTTDGQYKLLNMPLYKLPLDIIKSNATLLNGVKVGSLYRMSGQLNVSVAGTITHAGCILVGIIPPLSVNINYALTQQYLINTILSGPHAFLFANEATSVLLDIPWYCNSDLDSLDFDNQGGKDTAMNINYFPGNFGTLVMLVLNPLQPSAGSTTTLSIVVEANLTNLEVYVPTPRYVTYAPQSYFMNAGTGLLDSAAKYAKRIAGDAIDGLRKGITAYTGLHNPNIPVLQSAHLMIARNRLQNVDAPNFLEHLDPSANSLRIVQEPIFNTLEDEMAIGHIIRKRQYLGTFKVNQGDPVGKLLFCRPISPYQGGTQASYATGGIYDTNICNNIELLHFLTRAWKGDIKITIQSVMNNKQQTKLRLLQMYNPSPQVVTEGQPLYGTILQAPSHLMEFTAGAQEQSVVLPYLARNRLMHCARDSTFEALFHGMYYIYVAQPLANSADSPADVFFNVYMSLEQNFEFFGYSTELGQATGPFNNITPAAFVALENEVKEDEKPEEIVEYQAQSIDVMNEPQQQENDANGKIHLDTDTRMQPLVDIRPLIRRLYPYSVTYPTLTNGNPLGTVIPLERVIGESLLTNANPALSLSKMYYGKHIGVKMRITVNILSHSGGFDAHPYLRSKVFYLPPQMYTQLTATGANAGASSAGLVTGGFQGNEQFPLVNTTHFINENNTRFSYEFTIPNLNVFKFVGGPRKMLNTSGINTLPTVDSDLGNIYLLLTAGANETLELIIETAFTDETRMGFQVIAPSLQRAAHIGSPPTQYLTPGIGSPQGDGTYPSVVLPPSLYYTRR